MAKNPRFTGNGSLPIDHAGERVGHLVAIRDTGKRVRRIPIWLCKCDCGEEVEMVATIFCPTVVERHPHRSCGCMTADTQREAQRDQMRNTRKPERRVAFGDKSLREICAENGVCFSTAKKRLQRGWDPVKAVTTPSKWPNPKRQS